jgi:nicotinate-nucleotide adenylyltransferase
MSNIDKPERSGNDSATTARRRVAFYGGSFDPVHRGHLAVAHTLIETFGLDEFVFVPAFHAPHKMRKRPTSAYDRFAMLCLATADSDRIVASRLEIEAPDRPYTVDTLTTLNERLSSTEIFFVMGADSWMDITTWRDWEQVLTMSNHIVITRPGFEISCDHVTAEIRERIVDLSNDRNEIQVGTRSAAPHTIYITDVVNLDISATEIRNKIRVGDPSWKLDVPDEVAKYVEKYQIYS